MCTKYTDGSLGFLEVKAEDSKICRLCLNRCDIFQTVDDSTKETLKTLELEIDLSKTDNPIICRNCSEIIQMWFQFKSCLQLTNPIKGELNVIEVLSDNKVFRNMSEDYNSCQLCTKTVNSHSYVSLMTEEKSVIAIKTFLLKYFWEIDIDKVEDPVICKSCFKCLNTCSEFITNSFEVEEKVRIYCDDNLISNMKNSDLNYLLDNKNNINFTGIKGENMYSVTTTSTSENTCVNMDATQEIENQKTEIKYEDFVYHNSQSSVSFTHQTYKCEYCEYRANKRHDMARHVLIHKSSHEITMHKCTECNFETKHKRYLPQHMLKVHKITKQPTRNKCRLSNYETKSKPPFRSHLLIHKHTSRVIMQKKCPLCDYQTTSQRNLHTHMIVHKSSEEVTMHKCTECGFETKYKYNLAHHKLLHKNINEVSMYECQTCDYQTRDRSLLRKHLLSHKSNSEVTMHKCMECSFETKRRTSMRRHMLVHKDVKEVKMYKCSVCTFETRHRGSLKTHKLIHKDVGEVKMYKCSMCAYETKHNNDRKIHMLVHKDVREVEMHKCSMFTYETKKE